MDSIHIKRGFRIKHSIVCFYEIEINDEVLWFRNESYVMHSQLKYSTKEMPVKNHYIESDRKEIFLFDIEGLDNKMTICNKKDSDSQYGKYNMKKLDIHPNMMIFIYNQVIPVYEKNRSKNNRKYKY